MSLSVEALVQLEGLDLQEARAGLDFVSTAESRDPSVADLSADELREFRNWDFSGVLAGLNSLTFEAAHPELVTAPVAPVEPPPPAPAEETGGEEEELPDWLRSV